MQILRTFPPRSRKQKNSRLSKLNLEHKEFIQSILDKKTKVGSKSVTTVPTKDRGVPLSNAIPGPAFKSSVDDYKWKRDREEKRETILEIERKKQRVAPAFNKGGYTYISDQTDPTTLGRKL